MPDPPDFVPLGHPATGWRRRWVATRMVAEHYSCVGASAWRDSWRVARGQGLVVTLVVSVAAGLVDYLTARNVHLGHAIAVALIVFGAMMAALLIGNAVLAPVRMAHRERVAHQGAIAAVVVERDTATTERDTARRERDRVVYGAVSAYQQGLMQKLLTNFQGVIVSGNQLGLGENEERAFAAHFPDLVPLRDEWNAAVARAESAPRAFSDWLMAECVALAEADARCNATAIHAVLLSVFERQPPPGPGPYQLTGWVDFTDNDGTTTLMLRDAQSRQYAVVTLPPEPEATQEERAEALREAVVSIDALFNQAHESAERAEVLDAIAARDALVHPTNAMVMPHFGAPLYVRDGCPWCEAQLAQARLNG